MRRWLAPLLLVLPLTGAAENSDDGEASLAVKPLLCIVDQRTPSCDMRFLITWQGRETGYYCVNTELENAALRCWDDARSGRHEDDREVTETFRYWLDRGAGEPELASATVEVLRKDSEDRRRRRRTKYVWDLL
ncbi:MAG TPA: DUF3019 domain-containing protein [Woeseiaceae bacterium]|nr:DUF3019 domain-containing protein [Woeseiaceae bacterium]